MSFYTDKSPFWHYFKNTLGLPFISMPGALAALVHGLARYMDTVRRDILWVRDQFIPTRAEEQHIPLHGESRGVPRTRFDTDTRYRTRVERAASWHKLGGKEQGLPVILSEYGFSGGIVRNMRENDADRWAHFDIDLLNPPADFSAEDASAVLALANQYKPGRSVIGRVQFAREQTAPLYVGAAVQTRITVDHYVRDREPLPPEPAVLHLGAASCVYVTISHYVKK